MILLLDVISLIPEFSVFDENKIIFSSNIIKSKEEKLSTNIIPEYLKINKSLELQNKLKGLIITTGPGSYTSLRVGVAFLLGLQQAKHLDIAEISSENLINFLINTNNKNKAGVYINSANSQNFISFKNRKNKIEHFKIDSDKVKLPKEIIKIYYNEKPLKTAFRNIHHVKFSLKDQIEKNLSKIRFTRNTIIKPIYISNNKILN